jgi:hypothetical protein
MRFGASADIVIHPGVQHDVTAIKGELAHDQDVIPDLNISYSVAAADVPIQSDILRVSGGALVAAIRAV